MVSTASFSTNINSQQFLNVLEDHNVSLEEKISLLLKFKGFIKKELVNLVDVDNYFTALVYTLDNDGKKNNTLFTTAHSSLCYLIKRVAMQFPDVLNSVLISNLFQHLLNTHPTDKKLWSSSIGALEAIYLVAPNLIQSCLKKNLLLNPNDNTNKNFENINISLLMVEQLTNINKKNNKNTIQFLNHFKSNFEIILSTNNENLNLAKILIPDILKKYLNNEQLSSFLPSFQINEEINDKNISSEEKNTVLDLSLFDTDVELKRILNDETKYIFNNNNTRLSNNSTRIKPIDHLSIVYLENDITTLLTPFQQPKETEQNWKLRNSNINKFRGIFRGLIPKNKPEEFLAVCKKLNFLEYIKRGALSLRTTLTMNTLLLIQDFITFFYDKLETSSIDSIFNIYKTLLSSTKKISSQNACDGLIQLYSKIKISNKFFLTAYELINEKTILPRTCSSLLLRIIIIRYYDDDEQRFFFENKKIVEDWLIKGLTDAQSSVREISRITFWFHYKCFPDTSKNLINSSLPSNIKKSLEHSIPNYLDLDYIPVYSNSSTNTSSINSTRRTSIEIRNNNHFPSYAKPTQSSFKSSSTRSASDSLNTLRERSLNNGLHVDHNSINGHSSVYSKNSTLRKISAPSSLNKRPFQLDNQNTGSKAKKPRSPQQVRDDMNFNTYNDNSSPNKVLDLTGEFNTNHSNTLINKFMENIDKENNSSSDIKKSNSILTHNTKNVSHTNLAGSIVDEKELHNISPEEKLYNLLKDTNNEDSIHQTINLLLELLTNDTVLDFSLITKYISEIKIFHPQILKSLLQIPAFIESIPVNLSIELWAINFLKPKDLVSNFNENELLESISKTLNFICELDSNEIKPTLEFYYIKNRQKIFSFCFQLITNIFEKSTMKIELIILKNLLTSMVNVSPTDFTEQLYYSPFYKIYLHNSEDFLSIIKTLRPFSIKLNIYKYIEQHDTSFDKNLLLKSETSTSHLKSATGPHSSDTVTSQQHGNDDNDNSDSNYNDDEERYMQMTMVNPFKNKRDLSGNSVVHYKTDNDPFNEDEEDEFQPGQETMKLSEMTKVISVFQPQRGAQKSSIDKAKSEYIPLPSDSEAIPSSEEDNKGVISDEVIAPEREPTVKFTAGSPTIINEYEKTGSENVSFNSKHKERLVEAAQALFGPDLLTTSISFKPQAFEILCSSIGIDKLSFFNFMISELKVNGTEKIEEQFKELLHCIDNIQSQSFQDNDIRILITSIISLSKNDIFIKWLLFKEGYTTLLTSALSLLKNAVITELSLMAIITLLILNTQHKGTNFLGNNELEEIWQTFFEIASHLRHEDDEISLLLTELMHVILENNSSNFDASVDILANLDGEINPHSPKSKILLNALDYIVKSDGCDQNQLFQIFEGLAKHSLSNDTFQRFASIKIMISIFTSIKSKNLVQHDFERVIDLLTPDTKHVFVTLLHAA